MNRLNVYSFHRNIADYRFDNHNTRQLVDELSKKYIVNRYDLNGSDGFIFNELHINHGSILIFEDGTTKEFKVFDFGDSPYLVQGLKNHPKFTRAILGQYNPHLWKDNTKVLPGIYPETMWDFGNLNYETVTDYRAANTLSSKLYWRGSLYNDPNAGYGAYLGVRTAVELLPDLLGNNFFYGNYPIDFSSYIQEALNYRVVLSIGGGGGAVCGDICFRDVEMFGLGIPVIRPRYIVEMQDALLPDVHYVSVDVDFDDLFKYSNHKLLAQQIASRYDEVINDIEFLNYISGNAREWYCRNVAPPSITEKIITLLEL